MSVKGRKVSGRGETVAANYAFGPLENDIMIKHRLPKLQKKFASFVVEVEKDEDNYGECEKLSKAFLQELSTFEIPFLKSKAVVSANVREKDNFNELKDKINGQILQAQADIKELKKQLRGSIKRSVGSSKKFLLSTLPEGPRNDRSTSTVEWNLQTEKPSSHSKGERKTQ
ncbi:hypothetical protein ACJRO7_018969 [Eucalyptus globulus]|uniref:Uncharacterized protein n=1 Tax=Eucalyptus globulus TaxID=34317 RepID=A0ABD3KWK2_EUCGL